LTKKQVDDITKTRNAAVIAEVTNAIPFQKLSSLMTISGSVRLLQARGRIPYSFVMVFRN